MLLLQGDFYRYKKTPLGEPSEATTYASFIAIIIEVKYCEALPVNLAIISSSTDCPASLRAAVRASAAAASTWNLNWDCPTS